MYSFVAWISTFIVYLCFLCWAFLSDSMLQYLGITYYPSRYYAVALPAYFLVVYALTAVCYIGWNMMNTLDPEDLGTVYDYDHRRGRALSIGRAPSLFIKCGTQEGIPDIADMDPIEITLLFSQAKLHPSALRVP
jgi:hypothetical protein